MLERLSERVKRLDIADIKLIKWATFFATIIIVKLFPQLLRINYWILAALMITCSIRPGYKFWIKKIAA